MKNQFYTNGKFNRSEIMKTAWQMARHERLHFTISMALKHVWQMAKIEKSEELKRIDREERESNMSPAELAEELGLIF